MTAVTSRLTGALLVATSATSFGVMPVLTKLVYDDGAEPVGVLSVRFTVAGALLLVLAVATGQPLPRGRRLLALVALGGVGYVVESLAYFIALTTTPAGLVALLLYIYPAIVVLLGVAFLRDRPRPVTIGALGVAVTGTVLTIGPVPSGQGIGVLLGLTAAVTYAVYIVVGSRLIRGLGPLAVAAVVMSSAGVVYDGLALLTRPRLPSSGAAWLALLTVAGVCTVVATSTFFAGLARLGPSDSAVLSTLEPVVSVGLAALVLDERLSPVQAAGGTLVLAAVVVLARRGSAPATSPPPA